MLTDHLGTYAIETLYINGDLNIQNINRFIKNQFDDQ